MARTNTNAELWKALSQFGVMIDSTGGLTTTLSAAEAEGQTTISLSSKANAAANDYVRIGASGTMDVGQIESVSTAANEITLKSKIAYSHASGATVKELVRTDVGDLSDDGVQLEVVVDRTRIDAGTKRHAYDYNINHSEYRCTVNLENLSNENVALALGISDDNIHGAGTTADPYVVDFTPEDLDTIEPVHFWARGTLGNGNTVEVQMWDCRIDPSKSMAFARGQDAPAQLVFNAAHVRWLNPVS